MSTKISVDIHNTLQLQKKKKDSQQFPATFYTATKEKEEGRKRINNFVYDYHCDCVNHAIHFAIMLFF